MAGQAADEFRRDAIERAANEKTPVIGTVLGRVKGGLTVDIGIKAFLPGSQLEIRPVRNLTEASILKKEGSRVAGRPAAVKRRRVAGATNAARP